jgi:hypothetical protein
LERFVERAGASSLSLRLSSVGAAEGALFSAAAREHAARSDCSGTLAAGEADASGSHRREQRADFTTLYIV